jgi:hypothetical protein
LDTITENTGAALLWETINNGREELKKRVSCRWRWLESASGCDDGDTVVGIDK